MLGPEFDYVLDFVRIRIALARCLAVIGADRFPSIATLIDLVSEMPSP